MEAPFPVDEQLFAGDERISFSRLDNKYLAVREDGAEFEFDAQRKLWVLAEDEEGGTLLNGDSAGDPSAAGDAISASNSEGESRRRRRDETDNGTEVRTFSVSES